MKKLNKCFFALFLCTGLLLTSCSNDSGDNTPEESSGDYWPTTVGNQWVLDQNGSNVTMKIVGSEKIGDDTYFKFDKLAFAGNEVAGDATVSIKKVKGDYYIKLADLVYSDEEITGKTKGYEYVFFKDYLEVNQTWSGNYTQETTFDIPDFPSIKLAFSYTGTILERNTTATIKGVTYNDVIKFKFQLKVSLEGQDAGTTNVEYWIAKNVGVIKMISGDTNTELVSNVIK